MNKYLEEFYVLYNIEAVGKYSASQFMDAFGRHSSGGITEPAYYEYPKINAFKREKLENVFINHKFTNYFAYKGSCSGFYLQLLQYGNRRVTTKGETRTEALLRLFVELKDILSEDECKRIKEIVESNKVESEE